MHHLLEQKIEPISNMKKKLIHVLTSEMDKGIHELDTKEVGMIVDIIKDLSETERNCYETGYYESVIKAMEEGEHAPRYGEDRMGYNTRRYTNGQYAPNGYNPLIRDLPYIQEDLRMGYSDNRYGRAYRDYQDSKRFYTASHSEHDKKRMETHANEHLSDTVASLRDIWKDADPELKKRMKHDLAKLNEEMTV